MAHCPHERREATKVCSVGIRTILQKGLHHVVVTLQSCDMERSAATGSGKVDVSLTFHETINDVHAVAYRRAAPLARVPCEMERCFTSKVRSIDLGANIKERCTEYRAAFFRRRVECVPLEV